MKSRPESSAVGWGGGGVDGEKSAKGSGPSMRRLEQNPTFLLLRYLRYHHGDFVLRPTLRRQEADQPDEDVLFQPEAFAPTREGSITVVQA